MFLIERTDNFFNNVELDHCMILRENAGGDKDLFSVERKMQRQKKKMEQQRRKQYQKEKQREKNNVFNFMNNTFGDKSESLIINCYIKVIENILFYYPVS